MAEDQQAQNEGRSPDEVQDSGQVESAVMEEEIDVEALRRELEEAQTKAEETRDQLIRARADIDNLRKRQERELENAHKYALENFVRELLGVRDSLELGLSAAQEENAGVEKLREGMELTLKLLSDVMSKFGIEQIDPESEPFDPDLHQAMSMQPRSDVPPNTVVNVIQKGYTLNDRLVRPALVMVSQASSEESGGQG